MKCTICGQDAPPGATVCAHCEAALKRAYDTVSPIEPPARGPTATDKPAAAAPTPANKSTPESALPIGAINPLATGLPRPRTAIAAVIAILAVVVIAYYEFRAPAADRYTGHPAAVAAPAAVPATLPAAPLPVNATERAAASSPLEESGAARPSPSSLSVDTPKALPARPRKAAPSAAAPAPSAIEPAPAPVSAPSGVASAPIQAAPEPPVPDRWQQMSEAIAQCAPENLFARIVCEQRVRLRYCEGFWGQTPQCPAGPSNDHGQ